MLSMIPFILLVILNILIYNRMRTRAASLLPSSARERRDLRVASILVLIIVIYMFCHAIITYINIMELCTILRG